MRTPVRPPTPTLRRAPRWWISAPSPVTTQPTTSVESLVTLFTKEPRSSKPPRSTKEASTSLTSSPSPFTILDEPRRRTSFCSKRTMNMAAVSPRAGRWCLTPMAPLFSAVATNMPRSLPLPAPLTVKRAPPPPSSQATGNGITLPSPHTRFRRTLSA